jgi:hypothetical protein
MYCRHPPVHSALIGKVNSGATGWPVEFLSFDFLLLLVQAETKFDAEEEHAPLEGLLNGRSRKSNSLLRRLFTRQKGTSRSAACIQSDNQKALLERTLVYRLLQSPRLANAPWRGICPSIPEPWMNRTMASISRSEKTKAVRRIWPWWAHACLSASIGEGSAGLCGQLDPQATIRPRQNESSGASESSHLIRKGARNCHKPQA